LEHARVGSGLLGMGGKTEFVRASLGYYQHLFVSFQIDRGTFFILDGSMGVG
jgi:hypothetical protein